jgi:hypothetical protein
MAGWGWIPRGRALQFAIGEGSNSLVLLVVSGERASHEAIKI